MISDTNNPYAFATSSSEEQIPAYKLYDSGAVAVASFLGGPLAGTILMAMNYRRLGQAKNAILAVLAGALTIAAVIFFGYLLPHGNTIGLLLEIATWRAAAKLQGDTVDQHINRGGELGSKWTAAGIGSIFLIAVLAIIFSPMLLSPKITVGSSDEVYYSGSATAADARTLGDALTKIHYFSDRGASVILSKNAKDGTAVSFVVQDGIWDRQDMVWEFEDIGRNIAPAVGGFPIKVCLANASKETQKEFIVGKKVIAPNEDVYYLGSATEADATALGQIIISNEHFTNKVWDVFLAKGNDGTTISFVLTGQWDDPDRLAFYEGFIRKAAPSIGGLPVRLQFISPALEIKKEVTVN